MSFKKSFEVVQKNKEKWRRNLVQFQSHSHRGHVPVEETSLASRSRMPLKEQIVGRYQFLGKSIKGRKERVAELSNEVTLLWRDKLNFPNISEQAIRSKLEQVIHLYDKCAKKGKFEPLEELFDITKVHGEWLNADDKKLYFIQLQSKAKVGYSTGKAASKHTVHPSKRRRCSETEASHFLSNPTSLDNDSDSEGEETEEYNNGEDEIVDQNDSDSDGAYTTRMHNKSAIAMRLVTGTNISTKKA
ncbi:uncharacterized protein LOC143035326 [Oratosquilla oratoria]|uniref:uncharacterized protein LOC143035326 n=1 Tax=Oratosquilla oratoria TaxID=337810 RepID=UPI003F76DDB0